MKAWAVFLHDPNPIHLDPAVVKAKGLGERVINQGPANLAYLINMLRAAVPGGFIESLEVRYVDNVFAGDAVEAGGTVTAVSGDSGRQKLVCDVWLRGRRARPGADRQRHDRDIHLIVRRGRETRSQRR